MLRPLMVLAVLAAMFLLPAAVSAHPERATFFPDHTKGEVPQYKGKGTPYSVVCKPDSRKRVNRIYKGKGPKNRKRRAMRLKLIRQCKFQHIQAAVDAAKSNQRVLVMPGVYREEPSRAKPVDAPECRSMFEEPEDGDAPVATYEHQVKCPNSRNLIAVIGDSLDDADRTCDQKCNLQIEGMGREAEDVLIEGDRLKKDVIRADRADGFYLRNVMIEEGAFNNVDVVETNGFRLSKLESRYGQNYGVLTFASDNGVYDTIEAYGNGDSGIYPGSGPEGGCKRFGIEIRNVNSYGNILGYSGTAGNGTWTHDSKFHDNSAGISDDSFASGHPGMPQDCSKWERNEVNSNNVNFFANENEAYCNSTPFEKRRPEVVCPQFQVPVGSGFIFYGANRNTVRDNKIYDNWRSGIRLFYVPASVRGENEPEKQFDTSNGNRFTENSMGVAPDGKVLPNGEDVFWDEQGIGNCWQDNKPAPGRSMTSDPPSLPNCSAPSKSPAPNGDKSAQEVPCATWDPKENPDPPGCTWFVTPPKPR